MAKYNIKTLAQKEAIVKFYDKHGWKKLTQKYTISRSTLTHWRALIKAAKPSDPHPLARRYHIRPETVAFVKKLHQEKPELSLQQIKDATRHKQSISRTKIWHIITGR